MGDFNQYLWVEKNLKLIKSKVLEIGSKYYSEETFIDYRRLCEDNNLDYLGTDLTEGRNVDLVIDFTDDPSTIHKKLNTNFNTVICCSVLEHVKDIFKFSQNISSIIEADGTLFISVPFVWEYHGYPDDYWRFTPAAIEYLFNQFTFPEEYRTISSHLPNDLMKLQTDPNFFSYKTLLEGTNDPKNRLKVVNLLKALIDLVLKRKINNETILFNSIGTTRIFKSSCINMIGFRNNS
jgi:hypothetical protein